MPVNICCTQYRDGRCAHPEAPRTFGRKPVCINFAPPADPRVPLGVCALRIPVMSAGQPAPPPKAP